MAVFLGELIPILYRMASCVSGKKELLKHIRLENKGKTQELDALYDTGCHLKNPYTGKSVGILEKQMALKLVDLEDELSMRLIPYKSVGNDKGLMRLIKIDQMTVLDRNQSEICYKNVDFAVYDGTLSSEGEFNAILSYDAFI